MLFNSYEFIYIFLPILLIGFYFLGSKSHRLAILWLFLGSILYYGWWNPVYIGLILASMVVNYAFGYFICQRERNKILLSLGLIFNLGLLGYFKYTDFFIANLNRFAGMDIAAQNIILPLAISFFTFQQIAYLMDAYQGKTKEYDFLKYCLFVAFFPQLIAGPIVHHKEIIPQYAKDSTYRFDHSNLAVGLTFFSLGLFKKVMLADNLALYATPVFNGALSGESLTTAAAWIGTLSYTFQIYFDFSGYSDMAIGLGRMFGIRIPINFNSPYKAADIIDFWRRWHITLSRFLKDYLYIPLGGNRLGETRRFINLFIVMFLGGLWHGAGWTFVLWGMLHGIYLGVNHVYVHYYQKSPWTFMRLGAVKFGLSLLSFFFVVLAWVLFRAESLPAALSVYQSMFLGGGEFSPYEIEVDQIMACVMSFAIVRFLPNTQDFVERTWSPTVKWSAAVTLVFMICIANLSKVSEFIYFQF